MNLEDHAEQEEKLLEKINKVRNRLLRNKMVLVSMLNFVTFAAFFFAMGFYQWAWVHLRYQGDQNLEEIDLRIWINLLYMKEDGSGAKYQSYTHFSEKHCDMNLSCRNSLGQIQFYGRLCFLTFLIAGSLQLYDFGKIVYSFWKGTQSIESKNYVRHLITLFAYVIGLILTNLSLLLINPVQYRFGVSFWIGIITLGLLIILTIYEQVQSQKMQKQALILDLLQKQKTIRSEQIHQSNEIELETKMPSNEEGLSL